MMRGALDVNTNSASYPYEGSPEFKPGEGPGAEPESGIAMEAESHGTRRALCIGINQYPSSPLSGCVSDARRWHDWFQNTGFQTEPLLLDHDATRDRILSTIRNLITASAPGDVVAIQYSGHGTQLPDLDGDEMGGDTPNFDEALVPIDHLQNGYVIDDDFSDICNNIPESVNVTFFLDCCHSGTATRMMVGRNSRPANDARPRFLLASVEMIESHKRSRQRAQSGPRSPDNHREVLFSACKSSQLAWESNGQGDFTRTALDILQEGQSPLTNASFSAQVNAAFGPNPRQNPELTCDDKFRDHILLGLRRARVDAGENAASQGLLQDLRELVNRYSE